MIRTLLRLLATSSSLVALLLFTNSALAVTPADNSLNQIAAPAVSLNVVSSTLQLHTNFDNDHIGCSCGVCIQAIEQINTHI
ncbi:MAG: hypothetical protein AAGE84_25370 [Cyanobacteria bacterium P01_G01_bin.39]